ncbi:MAG TPA: NAD(P)-dependent oxidoreductase [Xanthobacteraceae bacterium]|nr:NAD(P)-dependent oxidoreductase [Xanthobacteraceae bacterium]
MRATARVAHTSTYQGTSMHIGIAGLGRMGAAMAARLKEVGHTVMGWNRSAAKAKPLAAEGIAIAETPAVLAARAEAVITILTDAAAIDAVYGGPAGLLSGPVDGKLFIEMSTVRPDTEVALAAKVRAKGAAFVECPVGGTVGPARQGKLIGLMGGEGADAARARPILEQLCRRLEHVGPVGAGATMKLAINMPLMVYWQALGETLALCRSVDVDPARLMDLFADTSGGTNVLKVRGGAIAAMLKGGEGGAATFDIDSCRKDLRIMLAEGEARGLDMPLVERTLACFDESSRSGWGARDAGAHAVYWSSRGKQ